MSHPNRPKRRKDAPRRPGRPALDRVKFTTTLPPGYPERLSAIGRGNASAGIVYLVDEHEGRALLSRVRQTEQEDADDYDAAQSDRRTR